MSRAEEGSAGAFLGSTAFRRLWLVQVVSAYGDWLGFLAIVALAARVGGGSPATAIGVVMAARLVPGLFLAPVVGVFIDRWSRKRVMVACDLGRGAVLAALPFVDSLAGLVAASFLLEVLTLLWAPAKEASVPNLVAASYLTRANSLSLAAAYGTFPLAAGTFALLAGLGDALAGVAALDRLRVDQERLALYFDAVTFMASAVVIARLEIPRPPRDPVESATGPAAALATTMRELQEGWRFVYVSRTVRAVLVGVSTALIGGGMLVPLGPIFASDVVAAGPAGFGLLLTALGVGVAAGVIGLSTVGPAVRKERLFPIATVAGGSLLFLAASTSSLGPAMVLVAGLGGCAGAVYVLGFTMLHEQVDDELRGRTFGALYTLVRVCVLASFALGPLLAAGLDQLSTVLFDRSLTLGALDIALPGVRLALWLAGIIIAAAGVAARRTLRRPAGE
jgi:dTMP kinase